MEKRNKTALLKRLKKYPKLRLKKDINGLFKIDSLFLPSNSIGVYGSVEDCHKRLDSLETSRNEWVIFLIKKYKE